MNYARPTRLIQTGNLGQIAKSSTVKAYTNKGNAVELDVFDIDVIPNNYRMGVTFGGPVLIGMDKYSPWYQFQMRFTRDLFQGSKFDPAMVAIQVVYQHEVNSEPFTLMWNGEERIPLNANAEEPADKIYTWDGEDRFYIKKNVIVNRGEIYLEIGSTNFSIKTVKEDFGPQTPSTMFLDAVAKGRIRFRMTFLVPTSSIGYDEELNVSPNFSLASHDNAFETMGGCISSVTCVPDIGARLDLFMKQMGDWQTMMGKKINQIEQDIEDLESATGVKNKCNTTVTDPQNGQVKP